MSRCCRKGRRSEPYSTLRIQVDQTRVEEFCKKWKIVELSLFGSVLRDDFRDDSDVDVLVTFADDVRWTLFHYVRMQSEFEDIIGRSVDFVSRQGLQNSRNYLHREAIFLQLMNTILRMFRFPYRWDVKTNSRADGNPDKN